MSHVVRFSGVFLVLLLASAGIASARPAHVSGAGLAFLAVSSGVNALPVSALTHINQALLWFDGDDHDNGHDWNHDGDHDRDHDRSHDWNREGDRDRDHDGDHDGDHDKNHDPVTHHAPKPTPEPSTILSFGAALLIGGGVFYSRRLRKNSK